MGYTSWGQPLSFNPTNAVVYNPDDYSDESDQDANEERDRKLRTPTAEGIASAMEKVDWIRDVVDCLSPENVTAGLAAPHFLHFTCRFLHATLLQ